jgi:hypothetical protein
LATKAPGTPSGRPESLRAEFAELLAKAGLRAPEVTVAEVPSLRRLWSGKAQAFCPLGASGAPA